MLLECLSIMRQEQAVMSKNYNGLEPAKGMEEAWAQGRRKIEILQELIHAYDSEPVRRSLANWQMEIMTQKEPQARMDGDRLDFYPYLTAEQRAQIRSGELDLEDVTGNNGPLGYAGQLQGQMSITDV